MMIADDANRLGTIDPNDYDAVHRQSLAMRTRAVSIRSMTFAISCDFGA